MNDSQKIEELLHHFRMEQKDFAEKCGILPDNISKIKLGKCGISRIVFEKIIKSFPEVNKVWLSEGEGEMILNKQKIGKINNSSVVGANVNGTGISISGTSSELIDVIKEQQKQIGELIAIINKLNSK